MTGFITPILLFATVFILVYAIGRIVTQTRRRVLQRFGALETGVKSKPVRKSRLRQDSSGPLNTVLRRLTGTLTRAEIDLSARDFLLRWILITLAGAVIALVVSGPLTFALFVVVSYLATSMYVKGRSGRRLIRFEEGLPDMLGITANSLRTGYSFLQAVQVACDNMRGPVREELSRVVAEISIGVPLEQAFRSAGARMQSEDFNLIITAILIQRQVGGNLSEVLDSISNTIRERIRLKREVKVLTTQGRMSGIIFMVLPVGVGILIYTISPGYISVLFQSPTGYIMVLVAFIAQVLGYFIIRRMVRIEA